jgi:DNA-binding HxlR family transcriptional regulator
MTELPSPFCPVEAGMALLSGKWRARILMKLHTGTVRFGELQRSLGGISEKVLTQQLRELERLRLVTRQVHAEVPPRVEYALSGFGRTLEPVLDHIIQWAREHREALAPESPGGEPR